MRDQCGLRHDEERDVRKPEHCCQLGFAGGDFDTQLVEPLFELANTLGQPETEGGQDAKHLAVRNLLRGYLLRMPTAQAVAKKMGITPLTAAEIEAAADDPARVRTGVRSEARSSQRFSSD